MEYSETKILKFARASYGLAKQAIKPYSSKFSKKTFTQPQHVAMLCVKRKKRLKYRELEELMMESPRICEELELHEFPDFSTSCKQFMKFERAVLIILIYLSACLMPRSGRGGIDSTCFDRHHCSKHYVKRCKLTIKSLKVTFLIDLKHLTILAVHITASRKHDSKILLPLVEKYEKEFDEAFDLLCADKGYDAKELRKALKRKGTRALIPYREFKWNHVYWNYLFNEDELHQRSKCETVNSMAKRNYGDTVTAKTFWNQFKEILILVVVHNIDRSISLIILRISTKPNMEKKMARY
jgi:IS5 family transposase